MNIPARDANLLLLDLLGDPVNAGLTGLDTLDRDGWALLFAQARAQRCLPCLHAALTAAGIAPVDGLSPDHAEQLHWRLRALALQTEAVRLHLLLAHEGIAHRFLKGIALAAAVYPEAWQRQMRDIDILVAPADVARARELLVARGGTMAQHAHLDPAQGDPQAKHAPPVWSPRQVTAVELHGHAAGLDCGLGAAARAVLDALLWQGAHGVEIGGQTLPCPSPEAMLLHLVAHGIHDHELNNGPVLIADLAHLLRSGRVRPTIVQEQVEIMGLHRATALALALLPANLVREAGLEALRRDGPRLPAKTAAALLLQDAERRNELRLYADLAEAGRAGRLMLLLRRVMASRQTMLTRWRMERGTAPAPRALPVLWVWFLQARLRRMLRGTDKPGTEGDLRAHLLRLRALRDGRAG